VRALSSYKIKTLQRQTSSYTIRQQLRSGCARLENAMSYLKAGKRSIQNVNIIVPIGAVPFDAQHRFCATDADAVAVAAGDKNAVILFPFARRLLTR
jgi:hypothetical protein